jgi:hypothetical protein
MYKSSINKNDLHFWDNAVGIATASVLDRRWDGRGDFFFPPVVTGFGAYSGSYKLDKTL